MKTVTDHCDLEESFNTNSKKPILRKILGELSLSRINNWIQLCWNIGRQISWRQEWSILFQELWFHYPEPSHGPHSGKLTQFKHYLAQDSCILSLSYLTGSVPALKTWYPQRSEHPPLQRCLSCEGLCFTFSNIIPRMQQFGEKRTQGHLWRQKHFLGLKSSKEFTEFFNLAIIPMTFQIKTKFWVENPYLYFSFIISFCYLK